MNNTPLQTDLQVCLRANSLREYKAEMAEINKRLPSLVHGFAMHILKEGPESPLPKYLLRPLIAISEKIRADKRRREWEDRRRAAKQVAKPALVQVPAKMATHWSRILDLENRVTLLEVASLRVSTPKTEICAKCGGVKGPVRRERNTTKTRAKSAVNSAAVSDSSSLVPGVKTRTAQHVAGLVALCSIAPSISRHLSKDQLTKLGELNPGLLDQLAAHAREELAFAARSRPIGEYDAATFSYPSPTTHINIARDVLSQLSE